ncbi:MAG: hypothetical protein K8R02_06965 [Anaerohalosphaeraceae bacterium]|nr:hypothetical protein [Anaerohalosphaeraceae bacterium]
MSILIVILVALVIISLPIAWLISEFKVKNRGIRCTLGILAILCSFAVAWMTPQLIRLNYNAWYGSVSMVLIETAIEKIEAGDSEIVLRELKLLQKEYKPTYENKAHYDDLVNETIKRMQHASKEK